MSLRGLYQVDLSISAISGSCAVQINLVATPTYDFLFAKFYIFVGIFISFSKFSQCKWVTECVYNIILLVRPYVCSCVTTGMLELVS